MTRWTVPTLVDTLYRNGLALDVAAELVRHTYPVTQGAEDFYWSDAADPRGPIVGPYALYEHLRGEYPSDAPTSAGADARTIVAALRGARLFMSEVVDQSFGTTTVIDALVQRTVEYIRNGGTVEATEVPPDDMVRQRIEQLDRSSAQLAGAWDSIRSIPKPNFGA